MRLAQPKVTVLLNGQGGDELLAGYVPYQYVYLRELLQRRQARARSRPRRGTSRDVLLPLVKRRLADRRRSLPIAPLLRPEFYAGLEPPRHQRSQDDGSRSGWSPTSRPSRCRRCCATRTATRWRSRWSRACRSSTRSWSTGCCGCRPRRSSTAAGAAPSCARASGACSPRRCARGGGRSGSPRPRRAGCAPVVPRCRVCSARRSSAPGPYWDADGARRRVRPVLRRRGRAVADLLACHQHRDLAPRVLRARRRAAGSARRPTATSPRSATQWVARAIDRARAPLLDRFTPERRRATCSRVVRSTAAPTRASPSARACSSRGDSLADGLTEALADVELAPDRRRRGQREGGRDLPGPLVPGRRRARPAARPGAVAVRGPHRVGHRPRHPGHDGARHPRGGRRRASSPPPRPPRSPSRSG